MSERRTPGRPVLAERVTALARGMAAVIAVAVLAAACSSRRSEPITGSSPPRTDEIVAGEAAFMHHCHSCHPHGEAGLGPSLNDKPLPGFLMRLQVRQGFGAMPAFDDGELSDEHLERIVDYLLALRSLEPAH